METSSLHIMNLNYLVLKLVADFSETTVILSTYLTEDCKEIEHVDIMFKFFFFLSDHIEKPVARSVVELPLVYDIWNILDSECLAH